MSRPCRPTVVGFPWTHRPGPLRDHAVPSTCCTTENRSSTAPLRQNCRSKALLRRLEHSYALHVRGHRELVERHAPLSSPQPNGSPAPTKRATPRPGTDTKSAVHPYARRCSNVDGVRRAASRHRPAVPSSPDIEAALDDSGNGRPHEWPHKDQTRAHRFEAEQHSGQPPATHTGIHPPATSQLPYTDTSVVAELHAALSRPTDTFAIRHSPSACCRVNV
jgi:hypothetical protein